MLIKKVSSRKIFVSKCVMCNHPVRMLQLLLFRAFTPQGAAGPSPQVIIGVTMESATVIRQCSHGGGGGGGYDFRFF